MYKRKKECKHYFNISEIVQQTIHAIPITTFTAEILPSTSYSYTYPSYQVSPIPVRTIDRHVQVQVPQPYPVPVTKHIAYPVPVPQPIEVPKPYYVHVQQPVTVTVDQPYQVEVPRTVPVVTQYVQTKANPAQTFFDNTATAFQDIIQNFPNLDNFQNFQIPSLPSLPSLPSIPSPQTKQAPVQQPPIIYTSNSANYDNLHKPKQKNIQPVITKIDATAETSVSQEQRVSKQEYIQPTGTNGGYVY